MSKKPRFFCDSCGKEVGRDVKTCPHCGKYFASVRCPSCGFTGAEAEFKAGCPSCGYSTAPQGLKGAASPHLVPAGKLPLWVYLLSIGAFLGAVAFLIFWFK